VGRDRPVSAIGSEEKVAYGDSSRPSRVEMSLERRFPPNRFGVVLVLLFATFVFMASGVEGALAQVVTVVLQVLTLLAALLASRTGRHLFRIAMVVSVLAIACALGAAIVSSSDTMVGVFFALNVLLVGAVPLAIGRALWRRQVIDVHTVLGAVCIYVLIGMLFSFLYSTIGVLGDENFFVQTDDASISEYLYFSFITLCTVGYGDFTPAHGIGRALASMEALLGQLYLVTIIAVLVSRVTPRRGEGGTADADEPGDSGDERRAA
jgi:drug/metabolite transporter (DMT)-like permease